MSPREAEALELWYLAQASPLGIEIATDNPRRAEAILYRVRQKSEDAALLALSLCRSPTTPATHLWIIRTIPRNQLFPTPESPTPAPAPAPESPMESSNA